MTDEAREADETPGVDAKVEAKVEADPTADLPPEFDEENAFPRMIFRKGTTAKVFGAFDVDFLVVGNKTALRNALDHGWHLDPAMTEKEEPVGRKGGKGAEAKDELEFEPPNPRPNEPDNAPFQNTPYFRPQTGEARHASPPDLPIVEPIPPEEQIPEEPIPAPPGGEGEPPVVDPESRESENENGKRGPGRPKSR